MEAIVLLTAAASIATKGAAAASAANDSITNSGLKLEGASGALILMVIGIIVVYIILYMVIGMGHLLIAFVNKFCPEDEVVTKVPTTEIDSSTSLAIAQAIAKITNGKGKVDSIKKL
jgi:oxaloacetate decarboxylase gamma subunit